MLRQTSDGTVLGQTGFSFEERIALRPLVILEQASRSPCDIFIGLASQ
jgi:hypothetical protein